RVGSRCATPEGEDLSEVRDNDTPRTTARWRGSRLGTSNRGRDGCGHKSASAQAIAALDAIRFDRNGSRPFPTQLLRHIRKRALLFVTSLSNRESKDEMTEASISLQDLRRRHP